MGPSCSVYARCPLTEGTLQEIDCYVAGIADPIKRTRKGRVWDVWVADRPFHVAVEMTEDALPADEEEILECGLVPSEVPFLVGLSAGLNGSEDYLILRRISGDIAKLVEGVATEPVK